jgi:hypothetical protein
MLLWPAKPIEVQLYNNGKLEVEEPGWHCKFMNSTSIHTIKSITGHSDSDGDRLLSFSLLRS